MRLLKLDFLTCSTQHAGEAEEADGRRRTARVWVGRAVPLPPIAPLPLPPTHVYNQTHTWPQARRTPGGRSYAGPPLPGPPGPRAQRPTLKLLRRFVLMMAMTSRFSRALETGLSLAAVAATMELAHPMAGSRLPCTRAVAASCSRCRTTAHHRA